MGGGTGNELDILWVPRGRMLCGRDDNPWSNDYDVREGHDGICMH